MINDEAGNSTMKRISSCHQLARFSRIRWTRKQATCYNPPPPPHSFLLLISLQFPLSTKPKSIKNWKNLTNRKHWPPSKTINKFNSCLGQLINGIFEQIDNMNSDFLNIFANITDQLKTLALCQNSHLPKKATPL